VDALTLAYRVALDENLLVELKARANLAKEHGRASFAFRALEGEIRFRRGAGQSWLVTNEARGWRVLVDLKAPGGTEVSPGWTVEVVWYAHALADCVHVGQAVEDTRRMVETLGPVTEARIRRIDLCVDVAGARVEESDTARLVRRARARVVTHRGAVISDEKQDDDTFARVHRAAKDITGISVCPGGALMCRMYDKRTELARDGSVLGLEKRAAEEARWTRAGWDGEEPILRVEFQIRGTAVKEFGLRDPEAPRDPEDGTRIVVGQDGYGNVAYCTLVERLDSVWQKCCEWVRLVTPGVARKGRRSQHAERLSECEDAPLWAVVKGAIFLQGAPRRIAARRRLRGGASSAQAFGCALSVLVSAGQLAAVLEEAPDMGAGPSRKDDARVRRVVGEMFRRAGELVADDIAGRWGPKALLHVAVAQNAAVARCEFARWWQRNAEVDAA
jgi:hypothetical protein